MIDSCGMKMSDDHYVFVSVVFKVSNDHRIKQVEACLVFPQCYFYYEFSSLKKTLLCVDMKYLIL